MGPECDEPKESKACDQRRAWGKVWGSVSVGSWKDFVINLNEIRGHWRVWSREETCSNLF